MEFSANGESQLTIGSLSPLTTYKFRVLAVNTIGHSLPSGTVTITTDLEGREEFLTFLFQLNTECAFLLY